MSNDALDVNHMNVYPGGQQRIMHDNIYIVRPQKIYTVVRGDKIPKSMKSILEERGISTAGRNDDGMRKELASHPDFKNELNMIERFLNLCIFTKIPSRAQSYSAQLKRYTKGHC